MQSTRLLQCILLWLLAGPVLSAPTYPPGTGNGNDTSSNAQAIVEAAQKTYHTNTMSLLQTSNTTCTPETISIRHAWDDLSNQERTNFINAVNCLTTLPSQISPSLAPGAKTLYDDFVYAHINQTNFIHQSALLLPWHRHFIWSFESALRSQCNYTGSLPYWPWERHSSNQSASPVFDTSSTTASLGGNGVSIPNHPATNASTVGLDPPFFIPRPAGIGGGCITSGAFVSSQQAHLGPVDGTLPSSTQDPYGLAYNPRCLTRDFLQQMSTGNLTYTALVELYSDATIAEFHPRLERGIHPASHGFVGGDLNNFYSSPVDPLFYLLHAQIDRVWTVWQGIGDTEVRRWALDGTLTFRNQPPSEVATVDSVMDMGVAVAGGKLRIGEVMDTIGGRYCYMYA